jgi:hypothetical protein
MRNTTEYIYCYGTYSFIYFNIRITKPVQSINVLLELELFKFVAHFINEYDLPENIINDLLGTVELSEIQSELFLAVVESCPRIKNNYLINNTEQKEKTG